MRVFTTGQVSRICNVATSTVNKWVDSGRLRGYRVPGSRHRRIPRENLIAFLKEHGVPMGVLREKATANVLVLTRDDELIRALRKALPAGGKVKLAVASSGFEAGLEAESEELDGFVVDFSIGQIGARNFCQSIRGRNGFREMIVLALLPNSMHPPRDVQIDEIFRKPFDPALLAQRIRSLVAAEAELT